MKKSKFSITMLAFVFAVGGTIAFSHANAMTKSGAHLDANDCSSQPNSPIVDVDSHAQCPGGTVTCCYVPNSTDAFAQKR